MAEGILIVDKPAGWTSQDVVAKLRGAFHEKRVGHGGTLDPMATGVLPVFFGRATRAVEFFEHAEKTYLATLRLGVVTNTQDITGEILETHPAEVSDEALCNALQSFLGAQEQIPPMYSAIKIGGKKLYELARAGREVARAPRSITVFDLKMLSRNGADVSLRIHCSKGTYVRTLCHDLGQALGCGGCMAALRRIQAGEFTVEQAHPLSEILDCGDKSALLLPVQQLFSSLPALNLTEKQEKCVRNGAAFSCTAAAGRYRAFGAQDEFLALVEVRDGTLKTVKSFFDPAK